MNDKKTGKVWQTADTLDQAYEWQHNYLRNGAISVELKPRFSPADEPPDPLVDVIVTLHRTGVDEPNPVLKYNIEEDEWMIEEDDEFHPYGSTVYIRVGATMDITVAKIVGRRMNTRIVNGDKKIWYEYEVNSSNGQGSRWVEVEKVFEDSAALGRSMIGGKA